MLEKHVALEFWCSHCQQPVEVKLMCSGAGVAGGPHAVASVHIPCPHCGAISGLHFELSGLVLAVFPKPRKQILEPSLN